MFILFVTVIGYCIGEDKIVFSEEKNMYNYLSLSLLLTENQQN